MQHVETRGDNTVAVSSGVGIPAQRHPNIAIGIWLRRVCGHEDIIIGLNGYRTFDTEQTTHEVHWHLADDFEI